MRDIRSFGSRGAVELSGIYRFIARLALTEQHNNYSVALKAAFSVSLKRPR